MMNTLKKSKGYKFIIQKSAAFPYVNYKHRKKSGEKYIYYIGVTLSKKIEKKLKTSKNVKSSDVCGLLGLIL